MTPEDSGVLERVLVTGGAGFIGSAVVRRLIKQGSGRVLTVDSLTYAGNLLSLRAVADDARHWFERVDICEATKLRDLFADFQPTGVIHLAAESHVDRSIDGPAVFIHTNIVGTFTVLQEALRYWRNLTAAKRNQFRIVHVSTDEVFGSLGVEGLFTEQTPYDPSSPYAASKAGADHLARAWHRTYDLPVITTNCSNNFGPYQYPEKLLPLLIQRGLKGHALPVYGDGRQVRDWLYVDDHAEALLLVLCKGRPGGSYNVSARNERRNIDLVHELCRLLDRLAPLPGGTSHAGLIEFVADRPGHDFRYAMDARKIEAELGWRPRHSFDDALVNTVRWYLGNQDWCEAVQAGRYDGRRLGLGTGVEAGPPTAGEVPG